MSAGTARPGLSFSTPFGTTDISRPSFNEDPWGPRRNENTTEPFEGDEDCRHYTGGYPIKAFNTEALYRRLSGQPSQTHRRR